MNWKEKAERILNWVVTIATALIVLLDKLPF
jgi:hypothetical protein